MEVSELFSAQHRGSISSEKSVPKRDDKLNEASMEVSGLFSAQHRGSISSEKSVPKRDDKLNEVFLWGSAATLSICETMSDISTGSSLNRGGGFMVSGSMISISLSNR